MKLVENTTKIAKSARKKQLKTMKESIIKKKKQTPNNVNYEKGHSNFSRYRYTYLKNYIFTNT